MINQNLKCITPDLPKEYVSTATQTGDVSSTEHVDSRDWTNDNLLLMVANKDTETDSESSTVIKL